ncbi:hypothetical protein MLD38_026879 [Melastoma candidum]|uniref:Uncharacterized protein n=1 Tax=Melastoma candidum TaxID=119954 RepID=A0ACB9P110_9MYRT|nr:hypothetical protein MLD38_026879 [Melastoma candidum]
MSELRSRVPSSKASSSDPPAQLEGKSPPAVLDRPSSLSQRAVAQTLTGTANLANLLPTGTLLAFQLLVPIFTSNGSCDPVTRPLTAVLLVVLALSCFLACFTDSVKSTEGQVFYGMATVNGLWLFDTTVPKTSLPDLSGYRIGFIDVVHSVLSVLVFGAIALRDRDVVTCLYPGAGHETQEVIDIVPVAIGVIASLLFVVFPTRRHGIGYPVTAGK